MMNWIRFNSSWFPDGRLETAWSHGKWLNNRVAVLTSTQLLIHLSTLAFGDDVISWHILEDAKKLVQMAVCLSGPWGWQHHRSAAEHSPCCTGQSHQHQPHHLFLTSPLLQHHPAQAAECEDGGWKLAKLSDALRGGTRTTHRSLSIKERTICGAASAKIRKGGSFFSASAWVKPGRMTND